MSDDGRRFTPRTPLPTQRQAHHPQVTTAPDGTLALVWDESGDGRRAVVFARGVPLPGGRIRFERTVLGDEGGGAYPAVAAPRGGVVVAWTSGAPAASVIRVAQVTGVEP
jgi:hypothetical protein